MTDLKPTYDPSRQKRSENALIAISAVVVILAIAIGIFIFMIKTKPKVQKAPPVHLAPLVECIPAQTISGKARIPVMGTVAPSASIDLKSKVGGEIIYIADEFIPGGHFHKGDIILKIDPKDYDLDIQKKESLLHVAQANLDLELGRQDVARGELDLMEKSSGRTIKDNALALRKPQLDQARAEYESAMADLEMARLNRERTMVRAPFNCLVLSRNTHTGAQVSALASLATLVDTDAYWIEAAVPVDNLAWITVPGPHQTKGSRAVIENHGADQGFTGEVIRISGQLNEQSRLAKVMIRVDDPLGLKSPSPATPLILNDYVKVVIEGKSLGEVFNLPRSLVRDNGQVWVFDQGRLAIRDIHMVWSDDTHVYIDSGLAQGDCVIRSNLSGAVNGMEIRSTSDQENKDNPNKDGKP